jgi:Tol biopolymer transport system component
LGGTLYGPVGSQVGLQVNAGQDLTVTVPAFGTGADPYNSIDFAFATPLLDGAAYQVTLKTTPAGQTCSVFKGASGTLPVAVGALHVGCEITDDLLTRNSNSAAPSVTGTFFESSAAVIGGANVPIGSTTQAFGEGRFVAFVSSAAGLATGATAAHRQIYWRDRFTGITRLVSANASGVQGNGDSFAPAISADGQSVAFESSASNLVAGDTNAVSDVFVWNVQTQTTAPGVTRVSVGPAGLEANASSVEPSLSGDGRLVAFSTFASNLTTGVTGTLSANVVLRNIVAGTNTLVSADSGGVARGGSNPMLSESGTRLAFYSFSSQLVAGDVNNLWDIFVFDSGTGLNTRVSLTSAGGERDQGTESASRVVAPAMSGNGQFVAYATTATNVVPGDTNGLQDIFVVKLQDLSVTRASVATAAAQGNGDSPVGQGERPSLSFDGTWLAFSSKASNLGAAADNVLLHNNLTGETRVISTQSTGTLNPPVISRDGGYVVFGAAAPLDSRFASSGLFAHYTQLAPSFWWLP